MRMDYKNIHTKHHFIEVVAIHKRNRVRTGFVDCNCRYYAIKCMLLYAE